MPLTSKGEKIERNMERQYGEKKGKSVFYASRNAGRINGVDTVRGPSIKGRDLFKVAGQPENNNPGSFVPAGSRKW